MFRPVLVVIRDHFVEIIGKLLFLDRTQAFQRKGRRGHGRTHHHAGDESILQLGIYIFWPFLAQAITVVQYVGDLGKVFRDTLKDRCADQTASGRLGVLAATFPVFTEEPDTLPESSIERRNFKRDLGRGPNTGDIQSHVVTATVHTLLRVFLAKDDTAHGGKTGLAVDVADHQGGQHVAQERLANRGPVEFCGLERFAHDGIRSADPVVLCFFKIDCTGFSNTLAGLSEKLYCFFSGFRFIRKLTDDFNGRNWRCQRSKWATHERGRGFYRCFCLFKEGLVRLCRLRKGHTNILNGRSRGCALTGHFRAHGLHTATDGHCTHGGGAIFEAFQVVVTFQWGSGDEHHVSFFEILLLKRWCDLLHKEIIT